MLLLHDWCHRPARPGDPVLRDRSDRIDGLRRTGYPGQAGA